MDEQICCLGLSHKDMSRNSTTFSVKYVFRGFHIPDEEGAYFTSMRFSLKNLAYWIRKPGFSCDYELYYKAFRINYKERRGRWYRLNDQFSYRLYQWAFPVLQHEHLVEVNVREHVAIEIRGVNGRAFPLSQYLMILKPIADFFTMSAGDICNPYAIYLERNCDYCEGVDGKKGKPKSARLLLSNNGLSNRQFEMMKYDFLFTEEELELSLREHLRKWLARYNLLCVPIALYSSAECYEKYADSRLLLLSQAIEAYHRDCHGGTYLSTDAFKTEVLDPLVKSIPMNLDRKFRDSLKHRLSFVNEYSLRKRLTLLISRYNHVLKAQIKDTGGLANQIADARNQLTHRSGDSMAVSGNRLHFYSTILGTLLVLSLMEEMGFSHTRIEELAKKNSRIKAIRYAVPRDVRLD